MIWTFQRFESAPAFVLAESGYDVWLGDNRGNRFSLGHKTLDSRKDRDYWMFSWEQLGLHDVPAFIEQI
jgi:lysosomal acid lipase/cholesteryl ester hydrolase